MRSTRRAHLLRLRHRLPRGQARARLRPRDRRARAPTTTATSRGMQAAWQALGGDPDRIEILIMQLVNLIEGGQRVADVASARATFVTLDDLIDDIGVDAARCFLLQRSHDTTLDLDLELARAAVAGQPRLLRAVRARAHREHPAQGGGGARRGRARRRTWPRAASSCTRRRARWSSGCWSSRRRCARPPSGARRTG